LCPSEKRLNSNISDEQREKWQQELKENTDLNHNSRKILENIKALGTDKIHSKSHYNITGNLVTHKLN
jgi:hypothetical protein